MTFLKQFHIWPKSSKMMIIVGSAIVCVVLLFDGYAHLAALDPLQTTFDTLSPPSHDHIMGTDQLGRDVFARVSFGTTFSLLVAFLSVAMSVVPGCVLGALSGFFGGRIDRITSLVFDALYALPGIVLAILIAAVIGAGITNTALAISIGYIPQYFRIVRGTILTIKERPFIEATKALGAGRGRLILGHMLPYVVPSVSALTTLNMGSAIVDVSGLGFLGLGIPPPTPEWGTDLGRGRDFITSGVWWTSTFPGLMIVLSVLGFTLAGEALDEIIRRGATRKRETF